MPDQDTDNWSLGSVGGSAAPSSKPSPKPSQDAGDQSGWSLSSTVPTVEQTASAKPDFYKTGREEPKDMAWGDVFSSAAQNIVPSAKAFGQALVTPFMQPKETAQALGQIGTGLYSKARGAFGYAQTAEEKAKDEAAVDQMGQLFKYKVQDICDCMVMWGLNRLRVNCMLEGKKN